MHGVAQRRARPLDPRRLGLGWDRYADLRGKRDRPLVLLGFYGAFRRSELVGLDVQDLVWSERGLSICLRKSKTDQVQASRLVAVPLAKGIPCATKAVRGWLATSGFGQGTLFRSIDRLGRLGGRLHPQSVSLIIKAVTRREGLATELISGHSLRVGDVTAAVEAGVGLALIQRQTGHASLDMLARYVRGADPFTRARDFSISLARSALEKLAQENLESLLDGL